MPLYDFVCNDCGAEFDFSVTADDRDRVKPPCPECNLRHTKRVFISTPHVRLNWKAYDRNDSGSDRLAIRAGRRGKPSPMDNRAPRLPRGAALGGD